MQAKKVAVIGQGYVGLSIALGAAKAGFNVIGFDINKKLINELEKGFCTTVNEEDWVIKALINDKFYTPTSDVNLINGSQIVIIAVPTPLTLERNPDLGYIDMAVEFISEYLQNSALIINESTSYPGTLRNYIMPKIQKKTAINFLFASAPERIDPGNKVWDLKKTPRVVAGITSEAQKQVLDFYQKICNHVVEVESVEVAEASKIFENTFRQVNIALVNEFSILCNKLGFSATASINAAATKPFGFIPFYPSIGVGGHCIPIDPVYLTHAAKSFQIQTPLIDNANQLNLSMPKIIVECIRSYLGVPLSGIKIQLIGLTYKSGVSDVRESPAIALLKLLQEEGADVFWYDENLKDYNKNRAEGIMPTIDLGILINYFPNLDLSIWEKNQVKVLNFSIGNNSYNWPKFF